MVLKGNKYFPEGKKDETSFMPGDEIVAIMAGVSYGHEGDIPGIGGDNVGALAMDIYRRLIVVNKPPHMMSDILSVSTTGQTDTITAPGVGNAIEVYGYQIQEHIGAVSTILAPAHLRFDAAQYVWAGVTIDLPLASNYSNFLSGLCIQGADNEALTLTNGTFGGGDLAMVKAVVYYDIVTVLP